MPLGTKGLRRVGHHVALEVIDRGEFQFGPDPADDGDIDALAVEVAVEIEQEHFQQRRAGVEHRPYAETGDAVIALAGDRHPHRIDAVLEAAGRVEPDIGSGEAEFAAALFAVDDLAGNEPGRAEKLGRFHHLALA